MNLAHMLSMLVQSHSSVNKVELGSVAFPSLSNHEVENHKKHGNQPGLHSLTPEGVSRVQGFLHRYFLLFIVRGSCNASKEDSSRGHHG